MPAVVIWYRPVDGSSPYLIPSRISPIGSGTFSGMKIPPGRYTVYAVSELLALDWADPELRRVLEPYGVTVDLKAGQSSEVELVFVPSSFPLP